MFHLGINAQRHLLLPTLSGILDLWSGCWSSCPTDSRDHCILMYLGRKEETESSCSFSQTQYSFGTFFPIPTYSLTRASTLVVRWHLNARTLHYCPCLITWVKTSAPTISCHQHAQLMIWLILLFLFNSSMGYCHNCFFTRVQYSSALGRTVSKQSIINDKLLTLPTYSRTKLLKCTA